MWKYGNIVPLSLGWPRVFFDQGAVHEDPDAAFRGGDDRMGVAIHELDAQPQAVFIASVFALAVGRGWYWLP